MVVQRGHPRIVVQNDVDLPQGGRGSSTRADTNFPQIRVKTRGNQKANFVRNNNARIEKDIARIVQIVIVGVDWNLCLIAVCIVLSYECIYACAV